MYYLVGCIFWTDTVPASVSKEIFSFGVPKHLDSPQAPLHLGLPSVPPEAGVPFLPLSRWTSVASNFESLLQKMY